MPRYFYVKAGGTAGGTTDDGSDGVYTSLQTGAFSGLTDTFDTIQDVFTDTHTFYPDYGDFVIVSNLHSEDSATLINIDGQSGNVGPEDLPITVMCVSDTAIDTYTPSTQINAESTSGSLEILGLLADLTSVVFWGLRFQSTNDTWANRGVGTFVEFYDCHFRAYGPSDMAVVPANAVFHRCTFRADVSNNSIYISNGGGRFYDCVFESDQTLLLKAMIFQMSAAPNYFERCDFSNSKLQYMIDLANNRGDAHCRFIDCAWSPDFVSMSDTSSNLFESLDIVRSNAATTLAAAEYQYQRFSGSSILNFAEDDTTVYRNASAAFPSGQQISIKARTNACCSASVPFSFELPSRFVQLGSTGTITVYLLSEDAALTDEDVRVSVSYAGTVDTSPLITRVPATPDLLNAGTALDTTGVSASDWTHALTTPTAYKIEISTTGGGDDVPLVKIFVGKANTDIFFCPSLGVS